MPAYLSFLDIYGAKYAEDREVRFSSFRSELSLGGVPDALKMPALARSGHRYQMCYNLKRVALKAESSTGYIKKLWKIRQAAICHQYDVETDSQVWFMADPHKALKERIGDQYHEEDPHKAAFSTPHASFQSSLDIHLLFCRWAEEEWRSHVLSLEENGEAMVRFSPLTDVFVIFPLTVDLTRHARLYI